MALSDIVFRTDDPTRWGDGYGGTLPAVAIDLMMWSFKTAIEDLQDNPPEAVSIASITQSGAQITVHLTDLTTQGPFILPTIPFDFLGAWAPTTSYTVGKIVQAAQGLYAVIYNHTSASSFDPGANDGLGHSYYRLIFQAPYPSGGAEKQLLGKASGVSYDLEWVDPLPPGGSTRQALAKASGTDFDAEWVDGLTPDGGSTYDVLQKASGTDFDYVWGKVFLRLNLGDVAVSGSVTDGDRLVYVAGATNKWVSGRPLMAVVVGDVPGPLVITGITADDRIDSVIFYAGAGTAVTDVADLTAEFTISADDEIDNTGGTDTTGGKLVIAWTDLTL
ncbi:MAG: hypothetical protein U1E62_05490 [Alsobacter sp.]